MDSTAFSGNIGLPMPNTELTLLDDEEKVYVEFSEASAADLERARADQQRATDARLADIGLDRREIGRALRGDPRR